MNGHGAGSISCRKQLLKSSSILQNITGTPTSGRTIGKMLLTGWISPYRSPLKTWLKRGMKSNNPVKGSFWQTDEGHFFRKGICVPTHGKCLLKRVFSRLNLFARNLTLQFSSRTGAPFLGGYFRPRPGLSAIVILEILLFLSSEIIIWTRILQPPQSHRSFAWLRFLFRSRISIMSVMIVPDFVSINCNYASNSAAKFSRLLQIRGRTP